jgi:hypothetical protein
LAKAYEYKGCSNMNISLFNIVNTWGHECNRLDKQESVTFLTYSAVFIARYIVYSYTVLQPGW